MSLTGRHVVVTRPTGQAAHLATELAARGALPVLYPVLEIRDIDDLAPVLDAAIRLESFDLAVFVSPNAIEKALALILPRRSWPAALRVAALGKSSERELARHGIHDAISPPLRFDSEALLELPELSAVQGKRVVIFRGEGGRELLGDTLKARGAAVEGRGARRREPELLEELRRVAVDGARGPRIVAVEERAARVEDLARRASSRREDVVDAVGAEAVEVV